jgi:hypothetical protein
MCELQTIQTDSIGMSGDYIVARSIEHACLDSSYTGGVDNANTLRLLEEQNNRSIIYGPLYELTTSNGDTVRALSVVYEQEALGGRKMKNILLLATDSSGRIIADISDTLYACVDSIGSHYYDIESYTRTGIRGIGLAHQLERAHHDLLQRIANNDDMSVRLEVEDACLERLETLRKSLPPGNSVIQQAEREHQRWLSLYGNGGKLGLHNRFIEFDPQKAERLSDTFTVTIRPDQSSVLVIQRNAGQMTEAELQDTRRTQVDTIVKRNTQNTNF